MLNTNERRRKQLEMPYGTACGRLRKNLLYKYVELAGENVCYKCGRKILLEDFTIEHKDYWLDKNPDLFWDLDNIAFSHSKCNNRDRLNKPFWKHGTPSTYRRGCKCDDCREWKRLDNLKYGNKK